MKYVNLYTLTEYSMFKSAIKLEELIDYASKLSYEALAITDEDVMHGAIKFYDLCNDKGIKPIIGLKTDIIECGTTLLYAKNNEGYQNLLKISSFIMTNKKHFNLEEIKIFSSSIIAVLPGMENEVIKCIVSNDKTEAISLLNCLNNIFDDVYLGLDVQSEKMKSSINYLYNFGLRNNIKSLALNKTVFLNKDDYDAYKMLRMINEDNRDLVFSNNESSMYLKEYSEIRKEFDYFDEVIANTSKLMEKCNLNLDNNKYRSYHMPCYNLETDKYSYLEELCKRGLNKRLKNKKVDVSIYRNRLLYELDVIKKMGFVDYFLIVYDYVLYAKKNGIFVGPGRGSAPSSLCLYSLGVTNVDPIEYGLLFERFLNIERISMPDIDIDFPDNKRDEMISYMRDKYGKDKVCKIATFSLYGIKLAIRDISKIVGLSQNYQESILSLIKDKTIKEALEDSDELRRLYNENDNIKTVLNLATKLSSLKRHTSTHAAGIVMCDSEIVDYSPLMDTSLLYQTQFEASDLEKIGLVKMDFLGLKNLTIIDNVIKNVKNNLNIDIDINNIDLNDEKIYTMFSSADTDGIFQFESSGMKNVLKRLKPTRFMDLISSNALFRPGPMDMIETFIKRKNGEEKTAYIHKDLEEILSDTYGVIVFQEQIMMIAVKFAGYSLGEADVLRRAVSKKKREVLSNERTKFINRGLKKGYTLEVIQNIYDFFEKFASYGFNKPHSTSYALIAYQMAYLKTYYYPYFMAEMMEGSVGSTSSLLSYILDVKKRGVNVDLPSINYSSSSFTINDGTIYLPLNIVEGIGFDTAKQITKERNNNLFSSYEDFLKRMAKVISKKQVQNLIYAGCFDCFNYTRKQMIEDYDDIVSTIKYGLFIQGELLERKKRDDEFSFEEIAKHEKEVLGFNYKYNIFSLFKAVKEKYHVTSVMNITEGKYNALVILKKIKEITTKNKDKMAFLSFFDEDSEIEMTMFPSLYNIKKDLLKINKLYLVNLSKEKTNKAIINEIRLVN